MTTLATGRLIAGSIIDDQIQLEQSAISDGVARYNDQVADAIRRGSGASLKPAERMLLHWYGPLRQEIKDCQRKAYVGEPDKAISIWGPAMLSVDADRLAVLTMHEVVSQCMASPDGVRVTKLAYSIGRAALAEASLAILKKDHKDELAELTSKFRSLNAQRVNYWANKTLEDPVWMRSTSVHLGVRLLWCLQMTASSDGYDKPFKLAFRQSGGKKQRIFVMDDAVFRIIEEGHEARSVIRPRYLPMIVQPYPWGENDEGGYVSIRTPFIAKPTIDQKIALRAAEMPKVRRAVNVVSSTGWRINGWVYDVAKKFADGGVPGIPYAVDRDLPEMPEAASHDADLKKKWKRERVETYRHNIRRRADRFEYERRMNIASQFLDRDAIYFPHQLCFRGRGYPIPPHLNHQGDDFCRGMLEFADSRPVTSEGEKWLRIECASRFGLDKASISQRVQWTRDRESDIERVVRDPMGTLDWWTKAEDPWQFLASCHALVTNSSHAPVRIDGTCNGLQHYTAMGRDSRSAPVVNMTPLPGGEDDTPGDVYSDVAREVVTIVAQDVAAGVREALLVQPHICRSTVKQPVMTSVYGVTLVGARDQVYGKLKEVGIAKDDLFDTSAYLSRVVLRAIGVVCSGATAIMDWLKECARSITAGKEGQLIHWTTPLGMPVVQPYRSWHKMQVSTISCKLIVRVENESAPVAGNRQANGLAPNFVHSLDAAHWMRSALACEQAGISFAHVHDAYWTHAEDTSTLARITREEFVELHRLSPLEDLHQQFLTRYPYADIQSPPEQGDFDLNQVLESPYFFN